jgi:hypothetical protein
LSSTSAACNPASHFASHRYRCIASAALLTSLVLQSASLRAQSSVTAPDVMVTRARPSAQPLRITTYIETGARRQQAIAHINVKDPKGPSPNDRNLLITLHVTSIGAGIGGFSTSQTVQLAEGQTQVELQIPFVNSGVQSYWDLEVFESGRSIEDNRTKPNNRLDFQFDESAVQVSYFGALQGTNEPSAEVRSSIGKLTANANLNLAPSSQIAINTMIATTGARVVAGSGGARIVPTKEASQDWRRYFAYQSWFVSLPTLRECVNSRPQIAKALREYVAAGGTVILYGVESVEQLDVVDIWLQREQSKSEWQFSEFVAERIEAFLAPPEPELEGRNADPQDTSIAKQEKESTRVDKAKLRGLYAMRSKRSMSAEDADKALNNGVSLQTRYVEGLVLSVNTQDPNFTTNLAGTLSPTYNMVTPQSDGNWFWRNLITSVGKPPVWAFAALVGLFGLVLGPGLLLITGMIGRRSLMIFCVPVVAILATLCIISYSVLYEGFDNHIRVISQTRFDVSTGDGFVWSRQNYFCGLTPREGISFSQNVYARPTVADQTERFMYENPKKTSRYRITNTDRQYWQGWIRPRQQHQALVGHPVEGMQSPVRISSTGAGAGKTSALQIENTSAFELPFVVLHTVEDNYYFCDQLAPGESRVCERVPEKEAGAYIQTAMVDLRPQIPAGMEEGGTLFRNFNSSSDFRGVGNDMISQTLKKYLSDQLRLPDYCFVTIVPQNELVEVPLEGERSEDLHIIIGEGQW